MNDGAAGQQVDAFLRMLFDGLDGHIEIRPIEDKRGGRVICAERCWLTLDELLDRRADMAARFKGKRWALFFGVLPRTREGGTAEDVGPGRVVWVDVDFKDFDSEAQARAEVADLPMQPTTVVSSGHGLHLYWVLSEEQDPAELSLMADALQLRVGGDACFDAARILRLPGSWNVKDPKKPRQVVVEESGEGCVYHYEDLAEMHADDLEHARERARARAAGTIDGKALDFGARVEGDGLPPAVEAAHQRYPRLAELFAGRGKNGGDTSGSGYDFSYTLALLGKGIDTPGVLLAALVARQRAVGRSPRARDLTRCVERAVALAGPGRERVAPVDGASCQVEDGGGRDADVAPPAGAGVLEQLVGEIEAEPDKVARTRILAGLYADEAALGSVVALWLERPAVVEGMLLRLAVALSQGAASGLKKRIERDAKTLSGKDARPDDGGGARRSEDAPVLAWGDEPELADRLIRDLGGQERLATEADRLYRYEPNVGTWDEVNLSWLRGKLFGKYERAWIRSERADAKTGEMVASWKPLKLSARAASGVVSVVLDKVDRRDFLHLEQPLGVPFSNGLVGVDGARRSFRLDDFIREGQRLQIPYDPEARCPEWMSMLRRIWPMDLPEFEVRVQLLQEFFAAAMFGMATKYQKVMVLVGAGQNGKSIVAKTLRELFPSSVCTAVPIQRMADPYYTEMLLNSRVNVVGELPAADMYEASGFKDIVDGGVVTARRIREAPITFQARAAHLFAANTLPPVTDHSDGFWRRWLALDFPRRFKETDPDYDPDILGRVLGELPGIARWVVDGAAPLVARKRYVDLAASDKVLDEWRCDSNSVAMFAGERLEKDPDGLVPAADMYRAYSTWCNNGGFKPVNATNFGRRIGALGYEKDRKASGVVYFVRMPLTLVTDEQERFRHW